VEACCYMAKSGVSPLYTCLLGCNAGQQVGLDESPGPTSVCVTLVHSEMQQKAKEVFPGVPLRAQCRDDNIKVRVSVPSIPRRQGFGERYFPSVYEVQSCGTHWAHVSAPSGGIFRYQNHGCVVRGHRQFRALGSSWQAIISPWAEDGKAPA
jgi:hypothetical protein